MVPNTTVKNLPIILLCAANDTIATEIISELIDNDVTAEYTKDSDCDDRVWRLVNKYYTADIRVHTLTDHQHLDLDPESVEAQIIYISQEELQNGVNCAERRVASSRGAWSRDEGVRGLLVDCEEEQEAGALQRWAVDAHALLVAKREPPAPPTQSAEPFAEAHGVQRLRDELHTHTWPNLRRTDQSSNQPIYLNGMADMLAEWDGEVDEDELSPDEERRIMAESEVLADALSAALALRGHGAERLERAETMLRAMCRAAGLNPDQLD